MNVIIRYKSFVFAINTKVIEPIFTDTVRRQKNISCQTGFSGPNIVKISHKITMDYYTKMNTDQIFFVYSYIYQINSHITILLITSIGILFQFRGIALETRYFTSSRFKITKHEFL